MNSIDDRSSEKECWTSVSCREKVGFRILAIGAKTRVLQHLDRVELQWICSGILNGV